jgi:hypothetical protein
LPSQQVRGVRRQANTRRLNNVTAINWKHQKLIRRLDDENAEEAAPAEESEPEVEETPEESEPELEEEEEQLNDSENENQEQMLGESNEENLNERSPEGTPTEEVKKEKRHFSTFKRLMHISKIINTFYAFVSKQLPEYKEDMTREEIMSTQLNSYQDSKRLVWIVLAEYTQLKREVDEFFEDIELLEMSEDEVLEFYGYSAFYGHIRSTQNVQTKIFGLLEARMLELSTDFESKIRKMLSAIYNIRHIDKFLLKEVKPYANDYVKEGALETDIERIEQGKKMLKVYMDIMKKVDGFIVDIQEGIEVGQKTSVQILWVLKNMNNLSLMTPEEIENLTVALTGSAWLGRGLVTAVIVLLALFW